MAKRISKKLLVGLGTTIGFGSVLTLMGLGVKAITSVDYVKDFGANAFANQVNSISPYADISQNQEIEKVSASMFNKLPTGLERFHFGNVRHGATMTPRGWLGVTKNNEIVLTSWSGEVLWKTGNNGNTIRNLRYDYKTKYIYAFMSDGETGLFQYGGKPNKISIAVYHENDGRMIWRPQDFKNDFSTYSNEAYNSIQNVGRLINLQNGDEHWRARNLINFDVVSWNNADPLLSWIPNMMMFYNQNNGRSADLFTIVDQFSKLVRIQYVQSGNVANAKFRAIDLRTRLNQGFSTGIKLSGNQLAIPRNVSNDGYIQLNDTYLLTSPFFVATGNTSADLHFFFSTYDGNYENGKNDPDTLAKKIRNWHLVLEFDLAQMNRNDNDNAVINKLIRNANIEKLNDNRVIEVAKYTKSSGGDYFFKNQKWLNAKVVTSSPANLALNRNMFDPFLVTFAYPYANKSHQQDNALNENGDVIGAYNVAQIRFRSNGLLDTSSNHQLRTLNFNLGTQYADRPHNNTTAWPADSTQPIELNFNRLLTVSPFDNSFTYGAMVNGYKPNDYRPNTNANNFFSMWAIAAAQPTSGALHAVPIVISNTTGLGGQISGQMTDIANLRQNGLIFAPNNPSRNELNFYFDLSGTDNRSTFGSPSGWTTTKVGALKEVSLRSAPTFSQAGVLEQRDFQTISSDNFATIVHDRADLAKWYPKTRFSIERPANTLADRAPINNDQNGGRVTIDDQLRLRDFSGSNGTAQMVDLVSHYVKTTLSEQLRTKLPLTNPTITTQADNSINANATNFRVQYNFQDANLKNWYQRNLQVDPARWSDGKTIRVGGTSWMVYGQFGKQYKMNQFVEQFGSFTNKGQMEVQEMIAPKWWDVRKNGAFNLDTMNNNWNINGVQPIRTLLQIVEPTTKPGWMQNFDAKVWQPAPLPKDRFGNESDFGAILKLYMNEVSKKINNQSLEKWSIANIQIRAVLAPNPNFAKGGQIWTFKDLPVMQTKSDGSFVVFDLSGQAREDGTIYKQMATSYNEMNTQGFGTNVESLIRPNWTNLPNGKKLMFDMPLLGQTGGWEQLLWPIIRKGASFSNNDPIFKAGLNGNRLELKPVENTTTEWNWLKTLLQTLNYKYGMFLVIEGWNGTSWVAIDSNKTMYNDNDLINATNDGQKTISINVNQTNLSKIRLRLVPLTTQHNGDHNQFIQWEGRDQIDGGAANYKLLSAEHPLSANRLIIDPNAWFNDQNIKLSAAGIYLDTLNVNDLKNYLNQLKTKFLALNNNNQDLWNKLDISFNLAGQTISGSLANDQVLSSLLGTLQQLQNDHTNNSYNLNQGLFYLWTGNANDSKGFKIQLSFKVNDQFSSQYQLVDPQGNIVTSQNQTNQFIRSDVATKVDVKPYFDALNQAKINVVPGATIGTVNRYDIPTLTNTNTLIWNKPFNEISQILAKIGINFNYQAQQANGNWTTWITNLNDQQLKVYNPAHPVLKIAALTSAGWSNTKVFYANQDVSLNQYGLDISLKVPKLIAIPSDFETKISDLVAKIKPFGGNTYQLTIDQVGQFESELIELLKTASNPTNGSHDNIHQVLEFKYSLSAAFSNLSAGELAAQLATNKQDLTTNAITMQVQLKAPANNQEPEFVLDPQLVNRNFNILANQNEIVKIYLHGDLYEPALDQIVVSGNLANLAYTFPPALDIFKNGTSVNGLKLQWAHGLANNDQPTHDQLNWQDGPLPNNLEILKLKTLHVRIAHDDNIKYSLYGPQQDPTTWAIGKIDLTKLKKLLVVDPNWFTEVQMFSQPTEINQIQLKQINQWEKQIWAKSQIEADWQNDVEILYQGFDQTWVSGQDLITKIQQNTNDLNGPYGGLVEFWDGVAPNQQNQMVVLKAKFALKANSQISFVDQNGNDLTTDDQLSANIKTGSLINTIDLDHYVQQLEQALTTLQVGQNPGSIKPGSLTLPANQGGTIFANLTFNEIRQKLQAHQIDFEFATNVDQPTDLLIWTTYEQTLTYNPQLSRMWIRLVANTTNLKVQFKTLVTNGTKNYSDPVSLKLQAPKQISIEAQDFSDLKNAFGNNTKNMTLDTAALNAKLKAIKDRHVQASQNPDFNQMPLEMLISVGDLPYAQIDQVVQNLANQTSDLPNRKIKIKYQLNPNADPNQWILSGNNEGEIASDQNSPLKLFVHDRGIWELFKTNTTFSGTNQKFSWNWPQDYDVNLQTGVITNTNTKGLKLLVTFKKELDPTNDQVGSDPYQNWSNQLPTSFDLNQVPDRKIYLKIVALDQTYQYEKQPASASDKIALDLNLKAILNLDAAWLDAPLFDQAIDVKQLTLQMVEKYEQAVMQNFDPSWSADQKQLVQIRYQFNNQTLTKAQLVNTITNWNENWGFLQLWNGAVGQKINTTFVKADPNGNYELNWSSAAQSHLLNTDNALTVVDFKPVMQWLLTTKIAFDAGTTSQSITKLKFGQIGATSGIFQGKNWDDLAPVLNAIQIQIEYRQVADDQDPNSGTWSSDYNTIKKYDDRNQFQIRFKINSQATGKNIQLLLDQSTSLDQTKLVSNPYNLQLRAALNIRLDENLIRTQFIEAQNVIGGNTKNLIIDANKVSALIQAIKDANSAYNPNANPSYQSANLKMEFAIGQNPNQWSDLNQFINDLKANNQDQVSNQINFRFVVENQDPNNPDFQVSQKTFVLNQHQNLNQVDANIKVKYFIHGANWETNAAKVTISGTNQVVKWNFSSFGIQNVIETNQQVFLKTNLGNTLQIDFTTNGAATYGDQNLNNDHTKGWSVTKPTQFGLDVNVLKIRIRPINQGLVYEPAATASAQVHQIALNIKKALQLDKTWLNQALNVANASKLVEDLTLSDVQAYEQLVMKQIVDPNVSAQVVIKYQFNQKNDLDAQALINEIQALKQANSANYGVVQLWNNHQGMQIKAYFDLKNPQGQYIIVDPSGQPITDVINYFATVLDTSQIFDQIDLNPYLKQLQAQPLEVVLGTQAGTISQIKMPTATAGNNQLANLSWTKIKAILNGIGIKLQARPVLDAANINGNWVEIEQVDRYNPNINQIQIQFVLDPTKASNFKATVINAGDLNANQNTVGPMSLNLKAPLKLIVESADIDSYRQADAISGNTKFIKIDSNKESAFINAIIDKNIKNNKAFEKLRNHLKIEYHLGAANDQSDWYERQGFIEFLKQQNSDQITNAISIRFKTDQQVIENQEFQVDGFNSTLINATVGSKQSKIKIYINENGMEAKLDAIRISGTNDNFQWTFPTDLKPLDDGTFANIKGLRIQYSTNGQIQNAPYGQANSDWSNQKPTTIDPKTKILKVQLVGDDGYVYGPEHKAIEASDPTVAWSVHQVDVSGIKSIIKVDLNAMTNLVWSGTTDQLDANALQALENKAIKAANADPDFQAKLQLVYQIEWQNNVVSAWNELTPTITNLTNFATDYTNQIQGLIKFNFANISRFATIKVKMISNDLNYVLFNQATNQPLSDKDIQVVDSSQIQTKFDFSKWFAIIRKADVILDQGSTTDDIKGIKLEVLGAGNGFLNNWSFEEIEKVLNFMGIKLEFQAPGSKTGNAWVNRSLIKNLNHNNELYFRISLDQSLVSANQLEQLAKTYQITGDQGKITFSAQNQYASNPIKVNVNLPIKITTKSSDLEPLFSNQFSGNTYQLNIGNIKQLVDQQVQKVLKDNSTPGTDLTKVDLRIEFSLDEQLLTNQQAWFTIDQFVANLAASTTNWQTNQIKVRYTIYNQPDGQQYEITDDQAVISLAKNDQADAKVKKYIHGGSFWDDVVKILIPQGTTDQYEIANLDQYVSALAPGLSISFNAQSENATDGNWSVYIPTQQNLPKPLGVDKNLWIRINVAPSYQFANQDGNNLWTVAKKLDASQIRALIKLQKQWLSLLKPSGDLINLVIDESPVLQAIKDANVLPTGGDNLISLEYQIKGIDQWFNNEQFVAKLKQLNGAKDQSRWILTHQDLNIRFHLNDANNQYLLNVDGTNINDENVSANVEQIFKLGANGQIDTKGVKAIINLDHWQQLTKDQFAISGDAARPLLTIKDQNQLDQKVSPYASEQLFKIEYSEMWNAQGGFDWSNHRSLLKADFSGFRDQNLFIEDGVQIQSNKKLGLQLISNHSDYQIQQNNQIVTSYEIDLSDRIQVTTQIENPFTKANKSLAILTTNDDGSAKFDQGSGQFKIVVGTKQNQPDGSGNYQLASAFIQQAFNQSPEFIDKVELVYQVFEQQPSPEAIAAAQDHQSIIDYSANGKWKQFNFNDPSGFSQNLKLKVGNYLMVALRIKEEFAFGQNAYQLLNNDHSVLIPVQPSGQTPGRVKGLFVDASQIEVDNINLISTLTNVNDLLDGWAAFNDLNLRDDQNNNLDGLDFEIQLFSEFYEKDGAVLISGSNSKLIKRQQQGMIQGVQYVDQNGKPINDQSGNPIYVWTDPKTNRLSAPTSANQATTTLNTTIDRNRFIIKDAQSIKASLFKNQKINLVFKARNGDYTLKNQRTIELQERVNKQLKFPVENGQNVLYDYANRDAFLSDKIKYEGIDGQKPVEKAAKIKTILQLSRQLKTDSSQSTIISGQDGFEAISKISAQIQKDFAGQLALTYQYKTKDGAITNNTDANFYKETRLVNGDQIILKLNPIADDLVFVDRPQDLIINITNLAVDAPEPDLLKFLRVEQSGSVDGKGSFRILVNDPNKPIIDNQQTLAGFQFLVRVWDANQNVKIKWTSDQNELANLSNGDRVEWKLVDEFKNPVKDAYYNTIAMPHDGKNLKFAKVNYPEGQASQTIVNLGIGDYPENDQYPADSGFVISGLEAKTNQFNLSQFAFEKIIQTLGPIYRGQDGNGALMFNEQYMEGIWYVDLEGNVYQKDDQKPRATNEEITLAQFFNHTTFYLQDPVANPAQVGFKFKANNTNTGNQLRNGDQVWATFAIEADQNLQVDNDFDSSAILTTQLPDVKNLTSAVDPLAIIWWVLGALGTLGLGALIWFMVKQKNKLKIKG